MALLDNFRSRRELIHKIAELEHRLQLRDEEAAWLREQINGYRNAFQSMETQHTAVGAQAKAYIKGIKENDE